MVQAPRASVAAAVTESRERVTHWVFTGSMRPHQPHRCQQWGWGSAVSGYGSVQVAEGIAETGDARNVDDISVAVVDVHGTVLTDLR